MATEFERLMRAAESWRFGFGDGMDAGLLLPDGRALKTGGMDHARAALMLCQQASIVASDRHIALEKLFKLGLVRTVFGPAASWVELTHPLTEAQAATIALTVRRLGSDSLTVETPDDTFEYGVGEVTAARLLKDTAGAHLDAVYWGREAVGAIVMAEETKRVLLLLRSDEVMDPGVWGIPGGKIDPGEDRPTALIREMTEEMGSGDWRVHLDPTPLWIWRAPEGSFTHYTFIGYVGMEFEPKLNWEHDAAAWMTVREALMLAPSMLHPNVRRALEVLVGR